MRLLPKFVFVITAGPTREYLDPVRFLSNPSTGKMGFAVARAARQAGHEVVLIAGPVSQRTPHGVKRIDVTSARDMFAASQSAINGAAKTARVVFIATAAVADWRPAKCAAKKLKKGEMSDTLRLVRNPDVLASVKGPSLKVGFAAETGDVLAEAERKCREKGLAFVVANDVTLAGAGFGTNTNRAVIVGRDGSVQALPLISKLALAKKIIRRCEMLFRECTR